jgi:hypothetical protein
MLSLLNSASTSVIASLMGGSVANSGLGNAGALSIGPGTYGNDEGLMSTWSQTFLPELNSLIADANSYASPARIQQAMGAAEAGVAQAMDQGQQNALRDLQSFGIDPSSGRYAQLDETARLQRAAAQAGAGNIAEQQVEAIGRALRSEAIQATAQLPSQAAAMIGANAQVMGVEVQQELGQLQAQFQREQLNLQHQQFEENLVNERTLAAMAHGNAPVNTQAPKGDNTADRNEAAAYNQMLAQDAQQGRGTAPSTGGGGQGGQPQTEQAKIDQAAAGNEMSGGAGAGGAGGTQTGGPTAAQIGAVQSGQALNADIDAWNAQQAQRDTLQDRNQDIEEGDTNAAPEQGPPAPTPDTGAIPTDTSSNEQPPSWLNTSLENAPLPADSTQLAGEPPTPDTPDNTLPPEDGGNSDQSDNGAIPTMDQPQAADQAPTDSTGELDNTLPPADGGNADNTLPPEDGGATDSNAGDTGGLPPPDTSGGDNTDTGGDNIYAGSGDTSGGDTSGGGDNSGGGDGGDGGDGSEDFAQGGPVHAVHNRMGAIPASMSPSGGRATDDVPATLHGTGEQIRLNQGEFIIPRDVVGWRGEGYYQKDIEKARKEREGAIARPTMKPAIPVGGQ